MHKNEFAENCVIEQPATREERCESREKCIPEGSFLEQLTIAQKAVIESKWRLRNTDLPKNSVVQETALYKKVVMQYPVRAQERIKTEVLDKDKKYFNFEYFNTVQSLVLGTLYDTRENALISSPTGTGKTELAILAILRELREFGERCSIVVLAPTKPLIAGLESTLRSRFADVLSVAQDTTDMDRSAYGYNTCHANILVTTPERYDILTMKQKISPSLLIIDEIHILGESRGAVLESVIIRSKPMPNIRIVGISATIPNYKDIASFINAKEEHSYYFNYSFKDVPLTYTVIGMKNTESANADTNSLQVLHETVKGVSGKGGTLVFINSRKKCDEISEWLREQIIEEKANQSQPPCKNDMLFRITSSLEPIMPRCAIDRNRFISELQERVELFSSGIGVHHAGMSKEMRSAVEFLFKLGSISIICCTGTLACGVNLPVSNVIVYKTSKSTGGQAYTLSEVAQMNGRAGRRGLSKEGSAVVITDIDMLAEYSKAITFQFPIESRSGEFLATRILYEIAMTKERNRCRSTQKCASLSGVRSKYASMQGLSIAEIVAWVQKTYGYQRGVKNEETKEYFVHTDQLVIEIVNQLCRKGMVTINREGAQDSFVCIHGGVSDIWVTSTELGDICYIYYLTPTTVHVIHKVFTDVSDFDLDIDLGDILLLMSTVDDYKDIEKDSYKLLTAHSADHAPQKGNGSSSTNIASSLKYPIRMKTSIVAQIIERASRRQINPVVSILVQAHIEARPIDIELYPAYTKVLISMDRIAEGLFGIGRIALNRSLFAVVDLMKSINLREWRHTTPRKPLEISLSVEGQTLVLHNPSKDKIFVTVSLEGTKIFIHKDITRRNVYKYNLPDKDTLYILRIESLTQFTEQYVDYINT
ncbi:activating signal cointegrator complex subunit 3 [Nematocida ausubeli]|nr:activating signal cointegrator complex subunit 3 [Nematocida ausubeli]